MLVGQQEEASGQAENPLHALRGEQIIGQMVYGSTGEQVGEIDNVVIGRQGGGPAAVVGVGGFLGLGERDVAIPLDQLPLGQGNRLNTALTKEQVGSMRGYDANAYRALDRGRTFGEAISG